MHGHRPAATWPAVRYLYGDHEPPHVHVYGDGEARIDIETLKILTQGGMSDRDVRRAAEIIEANRQLFRETWRKYHG